MLGRADGAEAIVWGAAMVVDRGLGGWDREEAICRLDVFIQGGTGPCVCQTAD